MSEHILELLGAYIDGELHNGQLRKVEVHLGECQSCLEEYQALQALSESLHAAPLPDFPTPERIAAEVVLRLPRKPVKPMRNRVLETGWWLVPVGLVVVWVFVSTTALVSNVVTAVGDFGLLDTISTRLVSASPNEAIWSATLGQFGFLSGNSLQWAEMTETFTRMSASQITWYISIALLYLSWIAIWWARRSRQGLGQPFDGGSRPTIK